MKVLRALMENIIVKKGDSIDGLMFCEEFVALVIFNDCYFRKKMET